LILYPDRPALLDITIRAARSTDRDGMLHVQIAALKSIDRNFYTPSELDALVKSKQYFHTMDLYYYQGDRQLPGDLSPNITLVATIMNGEIIGFAALEIYQITAVFVDPQYTRQKIATRLLQTLERIAIDRYTSTLRVVSSLNARSFYLSCGYTEISHSSVTLELNLGQIAIVEMVKKLPTKQPLPPFSFRRFLAKYIRLSIRIIRSIWRSI
jgi:putative acetyltransferase